MSVRFLRWDHRGMRKRVAEFWGVEDATPSPSLERGGSVVTSRCHIAFDAQNRDAVDQFFAMAVAAGGEPRHAPPFWAEYNAYAAFITYPDGNNIEAVARRHGVERWLNLKVHRSATSPVPRGRPDGVFGADFG